MSRTCGRIEGLATGFRVAGAMDLRHDDVSRLSSLAGRTLSGAVSLTAQAEGSRDEFRLVTTIPFNIL